MKNITLHPGEPYPPEIDDYNLYSIIGRDVLHMHYQYPREQESLCGAGGYGTAYMRHPDEEFTRVLCAKCLKVARKINEGKVDAS